MLRTTSVGGWSALVALAVVAIVLLPPYGGPHHAPGSAPVGSGHFPGASALSGPSGPVTAWRPPPDAALAGPVTQWPMFLHDLERTGANLAERTIAPSNASQLAALWQFNTTGAVTGSVAVVNGTAYFGAWDGDLYAVNALNGSLVWKVALPGGADYTACGEPGIAATPAVWNDTVFIGGGNPTLYALNASSGSIRWTIDLANVSGASTPWTAEKIWSSAALYNGSLYVGVASGCDSPLVRGALFQIGLEDHAVDHVFFTLPAGEIGPGIWSSPSIEPASDTIWVTTGNEGSFDTTYARSVIDLNLSNVSRLIGFAQRAPPFQDLDFGDGATLFTSSNGTPMVVAVNKDGVAYAFVQSQMASNGGTPNAWTVTLTPDQGNAYVPPAFDGHFLYFGTTATTLPGGSGVSGSIRCVYPDNGTTRWVVGSTSSIYGGLTYADGLVFGGLTAGGLVVLNASDGSTVFSASTGDVWGEPVVVNGEVLVTTGIIPGGSGGGSVQAFALPVGATASAAIVPGGAETTYDFTASATGGVLPYNVSWAFGDGNDGVGGQVLHPFGAAGTYTVTATITDAAGRTVVATTAVPANAPMLVVPTVAPNPVNLGGSTWINASVLGGAGPFSFTWAGLPPGSPSPAPNTSRLRLSPTTQGEYNVSLEVNGTLGQSVRLKEILWVDGPLGITILASPSVGAPPMRVAFTVGAGVPITEGSFAWQLGDGNLSSQNAPVHTYTSSGAFPVELTIRYPGGTHASASTTVTAVTPLVLDGTSALTTEVGRPAVIPSTVSGGLAPYTYDWRNLPVGCTDQNASSLSCTPTSLGAFPVVETVTDPLGTTESANLVWVVVAEPSVRAVVESNATGSCADPSQATVGLAASPSGGVAPFTYRWTGPGGAVRNGANAVWTVASPSTATFNLTATDSLGVTANATVSIPTGVPSCGTTGAAAPGALALAVGAFVGVVLVAGGATFVWLRRRRRS